MFDMNEWDFEDVEVSGSGDFLLKNRDFRYLMLQYECALMEIETKLRVLNAEFSLHHDRNPIESIKTRLKEPGSLIDKMKRKGLPLCLGSISEHIHDVAGVRVVCSFEEDVYHLRNCLLAQDDVELLSEKDYIENPKDNGYRSLHLTVKVPIFLVEEVILVPVEIQLRTIAMDFWASIEHIIRYKKNLDDDGFISEELYGCALSSRRWDKKMGDLMKLCESRKRTRENPGISSP